MKFTQLIDLLKLGNANLKEFSISNNPEIINGASIENATTNQITFLEKGSHLTNKLSITSASAILLPVNDDLKIKAINNNIALAIFENPKLAFAETLEILNPKQKHKADIHKSAIIGENVMIGKNVYIGPNVCIGNNSKVSDETIIHPGVVIYEDVTIGINNELHSNCVIHPGTIIENNCVIHSNAVIGSEGFGFVPSKNGWRKMPQTGLVILESEVEVGCNSTIDRPSVGETRIGTGTKIDNLVQIGHGVITGKNCAMASQVGIAGGAKLGDGVMLAGQVGIANRVTVGNGVIASSKCGIHTDIEDGKVISGFPAISNKLWLRCSANFKKLPEIAKSIRKLKDNQSK